MTTECMDNFHVRVVGHLDTTLQAAVALAMARHPKAEAWSTAGNALTLYWDGSNTPRLPVALDAGGVGALVKQWLAANPPIKRGPDIDGSLSCGFMIETAEEVYGSSRSRRSGRSITSE